MSTVDPHALHIPRMFPQHCDQYPGTSKCAGNMAGFLTLGQARRDQPSTCHHSRHDAGREFVHDGSNVDSASARLCALRLRRPPRHGLLPRSPSHVTGFPGPMPHRTGSYFHLHLVSDATGETLTTVARAATAQYTKMPPVEHVYPLVRTQKQLDRVLAEIEEAPGIVLYTLLEDDLVEAARGPLPRAQRPLPVDPRAGAGAAAVLSRRRDQPPGRRAAHAQCRIFQAHRCAQLHHAARRRPAYRGSGGGRCGAGRRVAHLEDADVDLSRQPRRQDRQCAAGARHPGRAVGRSARAGRWWSGSSPARSASCRSGRTGCSG